MKVKVKELGVMPIDAEKISRDLIIKAQDEVRKSIYMTVNDLRRKLLLLPQDARIVIALKCPEEQVDITWLEIIDVMEIDEKVAIINAGDEIIGNGDL